MNVQNSRGRSVGHMIEYDDESNYRRSLIDQLKTDSIVKWFGERQFGVLHELGNNEFQIQISENNLKDIELRVTRFRNYDQQVCIFVRLSTSTNWVFRCAYGERHWSGVMPLILIMTRDEVTSNLSYADFLCKKALQMELQLHPSRIQNHRDELDQQCILILFNWILCQEKRQRAEIKQDTIYCSLFVKKFGTQILIHEILDFGECAELSFSKFKENGKWKYFKFSIYEIKDSWKYRFIDEKKCKPIISKLLDRASRLVYFHTNSN